MAKSYSLVFIVLFLLTLGSCQSLEQTLTATQSQQE